MNLGELSISLEGFQVGIVNTCVAVPLLVCMALSLATHDVWVRRDDCLTRYRRIMADRGLI